MIFRSIQAEWLKTKRSAASWLAIIGGLFLPVIYFCYQLKEAKSIVFMAGENQAWENYYVSLANNMSHFLLPFGLILSASLITQMEFKNNAWKQLHVTPQSYLTIYFSKISVILFLTLKFFIFFNLGIVLSGLIPSLIFEGSAPEQVFPYEFLLEENLKIFVTCLPILAFQYVLSLRFKNFMISIGIGLIGLIGTLITIGFKLDYMWLSPFCYIIANTMKQFRGDVTMYYKSIYMFCFILLFGYLIYVLKKEKG